MPEELDAAAARAAALRTLETNAADVSELPRSVPIRTADGTVVTELASVSDWRHLKSGTGSTSPLDLVAILQEEHHRAYGRPWLLGRCYFQELLSRNIRPTDRVLDLGCGAGRVGVWLIPFLSAGNYFGVDDHLGTLWAFASYECLLHNLFDKRPNLMLDDDFSIEGFGVTFDVVLDLNVSVHLPMDQRERLFTRIANTCSPGARLFMPRKPKVDRHLLPSLGFEIVARGEVEYPELRHWPTSARNRDRWYEFRLETSQR